MCAGASRCKKTEPDSLEIELQVDRATMWVLGTEPRPLAGALSA